MSLICLFVQKQIEWIIVLVALGNIKKNKLNGLRVEKSVFLLKGVDQ